MDNPKSWGAKVFMLWHWLFADADPRGIVLLPYQKEQLQNFDEENVRTEK